VVQCREEAVIVSHALGRSRETVPTQTSLGTGGWRIFLKE